ncbi:MAG TPA: SpoIIE family protein phosphatase [Terriglobales bacterium]|nr:SpoIIE family protein phosphatase [Terriglobales bacterium]
MEIEFYPYPTFRSIPVGDPSQPGEARRVASSMANHMRFDDLRRGQIEIVVTELARNLTLHGGGGHLILAGWQGTGVKRLDIMAIDKGQGISNLSAAMEDGFSTSGTPGTGLGAVSRIASIFQIFTQSKTGTAVMARVEDQAQPRSRLNVGGVSIPIAGETVCGDAFASAHSSSRSVFMVVDGLGHGPVAAEAAAAALQCFQQFHPDPPAEIIDRLHGALRPTRGAAAAVAEIQHDRGIVTYSGVGNITGLVIFPEEGVTRNLVSQNGIVGHHMARVSEFTYPWTAKARLVMYSDGLTSHWNQKSYPGLLNKDPAVIAAVLYRDHYRTRDDATIVVACPRNGNLEAA